MWAQTWTPSPVGAGSFYLYNVGAKAYMVAGNNWGTRASMNPQGGLHVTLVASDEAYEITTSPTFEGKHLGFNGYVDNGDANQNWTFEAVEGQTNVYKLSTGSAYLFADEGATTTTVGADPGTEYAYWKLVTRAARIADLEANASKENPMDATFLLDNPNFDRKSTTTMWSGDVSLGGNNENYCAEKFNTTFDVNQTVTDAPKGAYALAFQGFYRYGGHGINPAGDARKAGTEQLNTKLYANDTEAPLMSILDETTAGGGSTYDGIAYPNSMSEASTAFSKGLYSTSMDFTVDVSTIKIGVKKTVVVTNDWTIFDNCRLTYYGPVVDFTIYKNYLATAVENLNAVTLPTQFEGIRTAVLAKYNKEFTTADDYIEAIAAIKAATEKATHFVEVYAEYEALGEMPAGIKSLIETNANTIITTITDAESMETATTQLNAVVAQGKVIAAAYTAWVEMKNGATALVAVSNDNATANSVLHSSITEQNTAVEAATTAEAIATATATLKTAVMTYVADANPTGDNKFDLTVLLTNPDVTSYWTGAWGVQPEGWYTDQEGGNFQVMANEEMGPGGEVFIEYWSENPRANDKFVLYQKITLPEGTYMMAGRLGAQQNIGGSTSGIYFAANDVLGTNIAQGPLSDASIEFVQAAEGEVKIGMKAMTGNCLRWTGINKIKLYKVAPKSFEIDETADYDATTEGAGDVDVTRTIKAGYNTLVLPFSLTQDEVEAAFGAGSKVYTIAKFEDDNISFGVQDGIFANEPVILYATAAGTSYTFEGRTVVATTDPVKTVDGVKFVGNYETGYAVAKDANNYILSDGKFYLVTTDVTLKSTRAYITVPASATVAARLNITFEDGDATAIDQIATEATAVKGIYNLQGQQLNGLQRGINIVNGKKVLVK